MNRTDFQTLSRSRQREARILLAAGEYAGAYYLAGYSLECALKACIARRVKRHEFPDKDFAIKAFQHNLTELLKVAGLAQALKTAMAANPNLDVNWGVVKDWKAESRYDILIPAKLAQDMYTACVARKHGVLMWIRQRW